MQIRIKIKEKKKKKHIITNRLHEENNARRR